MADEEGGVPAPNPPPNKQQQQQQQQQQQIQDHHQQIIHLNWSNFKPEFLGKPDKDSEVHLLRSNYWMNAHHFVDCVKVQRFCLILLREARLWYHSLRTYKCRLA